MTVLTAPDVKLKFFDLTGEEWREYTFPGYDTVMITGSVSGAVDKAGNHYIYDLGGHCHFVPADFIHLEWVTEDPQFRWSMDGKK
jgi:hypothetical protein